MEHPAFADAGSGPGIEVWTIENFEPVPLEKKMYGKFYNGDSYIVLKTSGEHNFSYDAHFWIGSNTTQDKKGSAAIWTVTLDDMLGGKAVHHREVQGHESNQFLGYFQPAIRYLEGGNESGFNAVETNAGAEKRLLRLSGCDNMRIEEVPPDSTSLTKNHCFILEVDHDIFVLMPEGAKATQRRKIISVANTLRDDYHNGRATIEIIDEFSSDDDVAVFFEALGSGSKDDLVEDDSTQQTYAREDISAVYLYRVLIGDELDLISLSKPYKQSQLSSAEVYILDTPCTGVYVWLGNELDADIKKDYNDIVQKYLDLKGYPSWVNVTRVTEGNESCNFKQYFHNWDTLNATSIHGLLSETDAGYFSSDADESGAAAKLIGKSATARGFMPDQGEGTFTVTRVSSDEEDVTERIAERPVLYQNDVYTIKYQYSDSNGEDAFVVYVWMGTDAEPTDKQAGLDLASQIEQESEAGVTVVKVPQGKEPKHFLSIFKGNLAIFYGSKDNNYKEENSKKSFDDDGIRLFRVEGTELGVDMRTTQVPESADVLEDDDVYILETPETIYVWHGKESLPEEQETAMAFVKEVFGEDKEIVTLEQGEETDEFWESLGGVPEEKEDAAGWRLVVNRRMTTPHTLTAVTVSVTGKIGFEDLPPDFTQQDLSDDGVYILDAGEELYFWRGKNTPERVKMAKNEIIQEYIADDGLGRTVDTAIVMSVKQGKEPVVFKKLFPSWEDDMWENQTSYEDIKNKTKAANSN
ncbi:unnamed protein product [Parnassius mnemosyne]|uniref:Gelsolin n=1 Tax=Parnassius mnemosyne TaxID=213953 RepID=A0AAV1LCB3_9NEOP